MTANLSENPQKINGLAGITLGAIVQSVATIIGGSVLGLAFIWRVALVAMACMPLLLSTGYIRLRVVVMKDQANKRAHEESAQLACEAAGSIRTVASLTREEDCLKIYSQSLEIPLKKSNRTAVWSNALFAFSQSLVFFVIALVFWYGANLVSRFQATTFQFFVGLMVRGPLFPTKLQRRLNEIVELYLWCGPGWQRVLIRPRHLVCQGCCY